MRAVSIRFWGLVFTLAAAVSLNACAFAPATPPVAHPSGPSVATASKRPTGKVTIDVSSLLGTQPRSARQALAYGLDPAKFPITHLRLSVLYPGMSGESGDPGASQPLILTETPLAWNTSGTAQTDRPAVPSNFITATAHAGPNRVFTVEALSGTKPLMRMKAAATVTEAGTATIKLNFLEDAIGRTIEALIDEERKSGSAYRVLDIEGPPFLDPADLAFLHTDDLIAPLRTYLTDLTGFDPATNTYRSDRPAPQYLRVDRLAEKLFEDRGIGWLGDASGPLAAEMHEPFTRNADPNHAAHHLLLIAMLENEGVGEDLGAYRITIIAPTDRGWMPADHTNQPFALLDVFDIGETSWFFKTTNMPPGRHLLVLHKPDGTMLYRELEVDIWGMRTVALPDGV